MASWPGAASRFPLCPTLVSVLLAVISELFSKQREPEGLTLRGRFCRRLTWPALFSPRPCRVQQPGFSLGEAAGAPERKGRDVCYRFDRILSEPRLGPYHLSKTVSSTKTYVSILAKLGLKENILLIKSSFWFQRKSIKPKDRAAVNCALVGQRVQAV